MSKFEFELISNESPERNPNQPFEWKHGTVSVDAYDMEDAITSVFVRDYHRDINELMEYDDRKKKGYARYENSWDGSYLEFNVNQVKE